MLKFRGKLTSKIYGVTVDYSKAIRVGRALADISQRDLSRRISVDPSLVSMLENGRRKPSLEILQKIAVALGIPFHLFTLLASGPDEIKNADVEIDQWQLEKLALAGQKNELFFYLPGISSDKLGNLASRTFPRWRTAIAAVLEGLPAGARVALVPTQQKVPAFRFSLARSRRIRQATSLPCAPSEV